MLCDILNDESLTTLQSLNISMNEINDVDVLDNLKTGLMKSSLRELDLSYNPIGNIGLR